MAIERSAGTVIVVDDDPLMRAFVERVLRQAGWGQVRGVATAHAAITLATGVRQRQGADGTPPPCVLLVDLCLPDLNGYALCLRVKRLLGRQVPVLLLTALDLAEDHARVLECGADDFLLKPIAPQELLTRVDLALSRSQQVPPAAGPHPGVDAAPQVGDWLGGHRLEEQLGWSGTTVVFRARSANGHAVAVKALTPFAARHPEVRQRFLAEARVMGQVTHPHVVRLHGTGCRRACPYYVMELLPGNHLEAWLQRHGRLAFPMAMQVAQSLASALTSLHAQGIVHGDLKPQNIYWDEQSGTKLADFGLAQPATTGMHNGWGPGTPLYMAPEQFGRGAVAPAADLYAFGATLYHLLAGVPPFTGDSALAVFQRHLREIPPPLASHRAGMPAAWDAFICHHLLAKHPASRPASMAAVQARLADLAQQPFE